MNWKATYEAELRMVGARAQAEAWLSRWRDDEDLVTRIQRRSILSFPHTALSYAGPIQTRVIAGLMAAGVRRAIALGVLHSSLVPAAQVALDSSVSDSERDGAFRDVSGAFMMADTSLTTPFGELALAPPDSVSPVVRLARAPILCHEFSLDAFLAHVRLAADVYGASALEVLPVYVGLTRHPLTESFDTAARLAEWLHEHWTDDTAIVTTGDVVHYGAVYGSEVDDRSASERSSWFRDQVQETLSIALDRGDFESAYQASVSTLKSDQRDILPVLANLFGKNAQAEIVEFALSDYSSLFDTPPPCLVASALIAYT